MEPTVTCRARSKSRTTPNTECVTILRLQKYQFREVTAKPSQTHFWEPPSFSRQLLVRVVNHTLLRVLIRSVSRFSTQMSVQWGKTLTVALLRTSEFFSAVTRARSKSHTTPNMECVMIPSLYTISVQWGQTLTDALLRTVGFFSAVTLVRSKSHTTPDTDCHDSLQKCQFSEVKPSQTHFWEPPSFSESVTRARSKSHTTLNTECVTIVYKNISSVRSKPSQMHFWEPPSFSRQLLVRVVNHALLLVRSVSRFSTKMSVQWGQTLTDALLRTFGVFSAVTRARSKSHTTPNTECVAILYQNISSVRSNPAQTHFWEPPSFSASRQLLVRVVNHTLLLIRIVSRFSTKMSVQWGQTLTDALWRTSEFFSAVTRARSKSRTTPNTDCVTIVYNNISSVRSNPHKRTFENLRVFPSLSSYSCA